MKILWITNIIFPDVCKELKIAEPVVGGWMYSSARYLVADPRFELAVATLYDGNCLKKMILNNTTYYLIPFSGNRSKYATKLEEYWNKIQHEFKPDVVHIYGTEYAFGLAYIKACGNKNVIVYIQGLVSVCERYYYAGINSKEIFQSITCRDIARRSNLFQQKRKIRFSGIIEKEYIKSVNHIIGRTSWDKVHSWSINPTAKYHFCNETLRGDFYLNNWSFDSCTKFTIFVNNANYPIKGLHQLLKAIPIILRDYPDTKVYVTGNNLALNGSLIRRIKQTGYARYIRMLLKKYGLQGKVFFMGSLPEKEIVQCYLNSNVFVCPSSIENSPNSLGEAQLLGVPCVASYVGGIPDMIEHGQTGLLYRFEEVEMLANHICSIFSNKELALRLSENGKKVASSRHDPEKNAETLMRIYTEITI